MSYKSFNPEVFDATQEPMFFGRNVNVSRFDKQKYPFFEKLTEKQLSFFWRPEEVDVSRDRRDYASLTDAEKHVFISNLRYQTLLDSVQGRSPNMALLPWASLPEMETWIETWAFSETIHSRSYTHILRNVLSDASEQLDSIIKDEQICARAEAVTKYYDDLIQYGDLYRALGEGATVNGMVLNLRTLKKKFYLALVAVNALEAIRFYVSFACTFAFVERELMEGNGKIVKFIARDENLHKQGTQFMLSTLRSGLDDPEFAEIASVCEEEAMSIYDAAVEQEKAWAAHLFKFGSMLGLNTQILCQYVEYVANLNLQSQGLTVRYETTSNPLPWINSYLVSDNVQVAPQETEISSYLVGQVDASMSAEDFSSFDL